MGLSFDGKVALIFNDEYAATEVYEWLDMKSKSDSRNRYLTDSHCDGGVGTPIYGLDLVEGENDHWVVEFDSGGYGTFDLSCIPMTGRAFGTFEGWVQLVAPCQGDDTYLVWDGDELYREGENLYDFYGMCIPTEELDDYPKQEDYQTMEDDEVVDDEEAYEEAMYEFKDGLYDKLTEEFAQRIHSYCGG